MTYSQIPMLTVLIATYNGMKTLPRTLEAFCHLEHPKEEWKLIIIDNGSTDHTQALIQPYRQRLPLQILFEPRQGKNFAMNTGLKNITGDLVIFSDDDVIPETDWLVQMRAAVDSHKDYAIFGGSIQPQWEIPPDPWLCNLGWPYIGVSFALVDPSFQEGPTTPDYVVGPNMAVRSALFEAGYQFDTAIGPDGSNSYPMGSETEFVNRMYHKGFKLWHCKQSIVYHIIHAHQMDKAWILKRAIRFGRGKYRIWATQAFNAPLPQRLAKYFFKKSILQAQLTLQTIRVARAERGQDSEQVFKEKWWLNYYRGKAIESQKIGLRG